MNNFDQKILIRYIFYISVHVVESWKGLITTRKMFFFVQFYHCEAINIVSCFWSFFSTARVSSLTTSSSSDVENIHRQNKQQPKTDDDNEKRIKIKSMKIKLKKNLPTVHCVENWVAENHNQASHIVGWFFMNNKTNCQTIDFDFDNDAFSIPKTEENWNVMKNRQSHSTNNWKISNWTAADGISEPKVREKMVTSHNLVIFVNSRTE